MSGNFVENLQCVRRHYLSWKRGSSIIQLNFSPGKSGSRHVLNI